MRPSLMVKMVRKKQIKDNLAHFTAKNLQYKVNEKKDLNYKNDTSEYHNLDIYEPINAEENLPVIMMIHGGGYISCEKFINEAQGKFFAENGVRVVNVNYSLQPEVSFIEVVQELFEALRWIEENADQYKFDKNQIFVYGDSAGGHYALLVAAVQHSKELQTYYRVKPIESGICGVAVSCPMTEIRSAKEKNDMTNRFLRKNVLHSGRVNDEEFIDNVSIPTVIENYSLPKLFLMTTSADELLYGESQKLHELLETKGIVHEYKEYLSEERALCHVFNAVHPEYPEAIQANKDMLEYFKNCVK